MEAQNFEKFSVTLPAEMARLIHQQVDSGTYGSASEVIRDAMRAWLQRERRLAALDEALMRGIADLDAGRSQPLEEVRQELKERFSRRE
jgi:antitoxin ParD1/3/4